MMSSASAAYHQTGAPPRPPSGEAEGGTSDVEAVGDAGGTTTAAEDSPVIEPALVYNKQGEVVELDPDVVKAVDGFKMPDGYVRKGARDGSFMYSLGVYAEALEGENNKYFCLASGTCRRSKKVIPCKRGDRSNVNTHHRSVHGLQGKTGVLKTEKKKMAQGSAKNSLAASKNSSVGTTNRVRELLAMRMVVGRCLPFGFFSSGKTWTQLMGLLTAETTPFPKLSSSRVKHLLAEMFVATKKVVVGDLQQEIAKAMLPIIHYGLDLCTCEVSGRKFLRVHVSYVDSNFTLQHALLAMKHYAPWGSVQGGREKASETLFAIFRATLAEHGIKLSDLAGGTTGSGSELEAMCADVLLAKHGIGWDRCDRRLADRSAERAFVPTSAPPPRKSKHNNNDAGDVIELVIKAVAKANQPGAFNPKLGDDAELEMLSEAPGVTEHAPQRWLCLVRAMERVLCSWHALKKAHADAGEQFPLDEVGTRDDFLQLYSLLQPLSAITRGGEHQAAPTTAETRLLLAKLKEMVLHPEEPLRVFDIPAPAATGFPEEGEEEEVAQAAANTAAATTSPRGRNRSGASSQGQQPPGGSSRPKPLPFSVVPSDQLRPATVKAREELSRALVEGIYSRVWEKGATDPFPYRDAAVLLTPPFSSGRYLEALRLTEADVRLLPAEKAGLAPTTDDEVAGKLGAAWAAIRSRASEAAREDQRRSASRDGGAAATAANQPLRKRARVAESGSASSSLAAVAPSGYASFGWGGPSVFASFGQGDAGDSTEGEEEEEEEEEDVDGGDRKRLDAAVADEIERYQAVLIKPKKLHCQNVLPWWRRTGQKMFPYLTPVAQQVLGNQAAAAQGDRDFSGYGNLLVPNRSRTHTYWVEMVMFLKENFEHIPAWKDIPTIAAKDICACLPERFDGRDADLVADEAAFDVLNNTSYPTVDAIGLEG